MSRLPFVCVTLALLVAADSVHAGPSPAPVAFTPDPASIQRCGSAYRFPQAGWIYLHIEGEPYERGYQYGKLLSPEIADYIKALATYRSPKAPTEAWRDMRLLCNVLFLRRYDPEYLEEMKGIADGAAAAGAKFDGRAVDLQDIVAVNSSIEIDFLDSAAESTPTGLEGKRFQEPPYAKPKKLPPSHCSAFAATGPATADGKIVFGHITMWNLYHVRHFNVWLDVKPAKGHRVLMQTFPGGIMSGMDYYLNDAGLLVAETTITQTHFDVNGWSLVARIRKALQYADSIDKAVEILAKDNNGLYTNEWLLGDTKTNEIAMFELGTHKSKLWRSGKNEWIGNTPGFYWGCNNTKDLQVRLETIPGVEGRPGNMVFAPTDRDLTWMRLYDKYKGKINADFGFEAFTTPPLAAFPSCDAKFTTSAMAKELKTYALFGPPLGRTWEATAQEKTKYGDIQPLVSNDWAILSGQPPAETPASVAGDLGKTIKRQSDSDEASETEEAFGQARKTEITPAWHGTILPKNEAAIWLAAAFAEYERIVALEKSLKANAKDGKLSDEEKDQLEVASFAPRSKYLAAVRTWGRDPNLLDTKTDFRSSEWYAVAAGKGVLLLADLRLLMGADAFEKMMDEFGRANAGKEVTTEQFFEHAEKAYGKPLAEFSAKWLTGDRKPFETNGSGACWSTLSFEKEPEKTLIVYGTLKETAAQREAAERLQQHLRRRWANVTIPVKADKDVTDDELKSHHLLVLGRPDSNTTAAKCGSSLPLTFGQASLVLRNRTYAHPSSAVIAAGDNPLNGRFSVVLFAGLSADSTWQCVERLPGVAAEAVLFAAGEKPRAMVVNGKNGNGKGH